MAYESFSVSELIPAAPERIYAAWLNSDEHTKFTGDTAEIEPFVGGRHSAFDGYAVGSTVELQPGRRIVQTWRATDFPPGSPDSRVEVTLEATVGGTMVTIFHTELPSGQSDSYRQSWLKYYLEPLKGYFGQQVARASNGVPSKAPKAIVSSEPRRKAAARKKLTGEANPNEARSNAKKPTPKAGPTRTRSKTKANKSKKAAPRAAEPKAAKRGTPKAAKPATRKAAKPAIPKNLRKRPKSGRARASAKPPSRTSRGR